MLTPFPGADDLDVFDSSFSFSKFPNLQEVNFAFRFGWINGGLPWIPGVLSTLRPTTSPCLSAVRLEFTCDPTAAQPIESLIREVGNHFRQVADEVARIEREFDGAVNFTVVPDPKFEVVLGRLNVRFRFAMSTRAHGRMDSFPPVVCRSFSVTVAKMFHFSPVVLRP